METKQFLKRATNSNGKKQIEVDGHRTGMIIRDEYWKLISKSPYSASRLIDEALKNYFRDEFKLRLTATINTLYEDLLMLEKLKDLGKMGTTAFSIEHQMTMENCKEAIRILENSAILDDKEVR